jgi:galactonate dehydratase
MLDCHGRLNLAGAVRLCAALAPFRLLVIEEPIPPESPGEYARLTQRSSTPIAAGERLVSVYDARPFLEVGALSVLLCDVVNCGGFTGAPQKRCAGGGVLRAVRSAPPERAAGYARGGPSS